MDERSDSCAATEKRALSVAEAQQRIRSLIEPLAAHESIALREALGRVTACAVHSPIDVPPHDNSAMDGYAVRGSDLPTDGRREFRVVGTVFAGRPYTGVLQAGECVRIMTGGVMPDGADTVIMQEDVQRHGDITYIGGGHKPGSHVRHIGEDIAKHDVVIGAGKRIGPADLGVLASLGTAQLDVVRRPRVVFFATGDELRPVGEPLSAGCLYDSNSYTLHGQLTQLGLEPRSFGIVPDQREALNTSLQRAAAEADLIISTGGVSVGEADFVRDILQTLGEIHLWRVAMKPGRPFAFGRVDRAWFFGLPGNPVSTMATFLQFVQPALRRLMGEQPLLPFRFKLRCVHVLKKTPGRIEFQRGIMETDNEGNTVVRSTGAQGSAILSSMSKANCFIVLPAECGDIAAGSIVDVQPFALLL